MRLSERWELEHDSDFAAGVELLRPHWRGLVTLRVFDRMCSLATSGGYVESLMRDKLRDALCEIEVEESEPIAAIESPTNITVETTEVATTGDVKATPETIALHKRHSHHHALMVAAKDDDERAFHATIIMEDILPELDRLYDLQRGVEMTEKPTNVENPVIGDNYKKLHTIRTRISTLKREIPKAKTIERKAELTKQLEEKEAEKNRLEGLLT